MIQVRIQSQPKVQIRPQAQPKIQVNIKNEILLVGDYDDYEGEYEIVPKLFQSQELNTKDFVLRQNLIVKEIPVTFTENESGGYTVCIGG